MPPPSRLIPIFHRRWTVPILAELDRRDGGAKFVTLAHATGASEGALRQTLDDLIGRGLVRRNSGYGHPLRPEYLLTRPGEGLAPACARLDDTLTTLNARAVALKKWSMPVLDAVREGPARFNQIGDTLTGITDRALAMALRDLSSASLISRKVIETYPPASAYLGTEAGLRVVPILAEIG